MQPMRPRSIEEIQEDYMGRRAGLLRALREDADKFYALCDPAKETLFLCGHANGEWSVTPEVLVPPDLPEPALGINFLRDGMNRRDWLSLVAVHSDSWLFSVAFFPGARLNRDERERLFSFINNLPTIFEELSHGKPVKDKQCIIDSGSQPKEKEEGVISIQEDLGLSPSHPLTMKNPSWPRTVEKIFNDYIGRRTGLVRALIHDVDDFYRLCNPEKENLRLYGHPNGEWKVALVNKSPPELPEPVVGINFVMDAMTRRDWLLLVALHSDPKRLFSLINHVPTVFEEFTARKHVIGEVPFDRGSKSRRLKKRSSEHRETLCGRCGRNCNEDEFWIRCGNCQGWSQGKFVKRRPAKAESIEPVQVPRTWFGFFASK